MDFCDVSIVTATIPPRFALLDEARESVDAQTLRPTTHLISVDYKGQGSAVTRNQALKGAETEWVAFLDDDDLLKPQHLERLLAAAAEKGADLVYPWFTCDGTEQLFAEGKPFDPEDIRRRNYIPVTVLVRTSLVQKVGGFPTPEDKDWIGNPVSACDEHGLWLRLLNAGAYFYHLPERTWHYRIHGGNTLGHDWTQRFV